RDLIVTGVQTCALPIFSASRKQKTGWNPPQPVAERSLRRRALPLVFPLKALDAPGSVHELLLAGIEGMALRADLHPDVGPGRARSEERRVGKEGGTGRG